MLSKVHSTISKNAIHSLRSFGTIKTFSKVMAANRGEIALRIMRASQELSIPTVGVYSWEDRFGMWRYKADQSFLLNRDKSPVAQYLDIPFIVDLAVKNGVSAVHPGYGFLSENAQFAQALEDAGVAFIGPTVRNLDLMASKTAARDLAISHKIPVVPGTPGPVETVEQATKFCNEIGFPVIIKAAFGGGGKGMRVVKRMEDLQQNFELAAREALAAFGNGTVFIERYVDMPRHIEVQVMGDGSGKVVHLFERDCSVQRRHQKVIENAPAFNLDVKVRDAVLADAVRLCSLIKYRNAGTVEFLVDQQGRHYFMEVNPRIQVEHTVTEEVTGIDIVQKQIQIAQGYTLDDLGLKQENIKTRGYAIQARITTENPAKNFQPDTGVIRAFREGSGQGVRLDGVGYQGLEITPHYDSMLVKVTCRADTWENTMNKLFRALREYRVRGLSTNVPFLLNVLDNPVYRTGKATTYFIEQNPSLVQPRPSRNRGEKTLNYLANLLVNGHPSELGATGPAPLPTDPVVPPTPKTAIPRGWRQVFLEKGPKGFAKAVRDNKNLLLTDTTWRDAHQSVLATRMRTKDILAIAPLTAHLMPNLYSLECWGGATFDVAMRFLNECPWDRLSQMRELVPNIPFQMLLRGANAVGYSAYADNVNYKFCDMAVKTGMDVFRVFDSLNYLENMRLGIDCVGSAGGIIEASACYTGDCASPKETKYTVDYYLDFVRKLVGLGIHVLNIKDMAGLLTPQSAKLLVGSIRQEFPDLPIHIHTHDTAGTGVFSMVECAKAGADVVDVAIDSMSGMTSQPSMGAVIASVMNTPLDTGYSLEQIGILNDYWTDVRGVYQPFESGTKSGSSDVYLHEMPGGQYTNLMYQSQQLGLQGMWPAVKKAYQEANELCGDIIKVTPSSKIVGDLANFMVQNKLNKQQVIDRAEELNFPTSVMEYFQGYLGIPEPWGFPEPFRSRVVKGKKLPNGMEMLVGRPGAEIPPFDFEEAKKDLVAKFGAERAQDHDVLSYVMYPKVFNDWKTYEDRFGDVTKIPTRAYLSPMKMNEEIAIEHEPGKTTYITLKSLSGLNAKGEREVGFSLNGVNRSVFVRDEKSGLKIVLREKAKEGNNSQVGSPMTGSVVDVKVIAGVEVKAGQPICILSAAKMETVVTAPMSGVLKRVIVTKGEKLDAGDLLVEITPKA